jgi:phenylalanyl-tRNA synthetase beta chain
MKVSLNWLKEYVSIDIPPQELADRLTMAGLEVEAVVDRYQYLNTVLVGRISAISPHPKADNLKLCDVDLGDRTLSVVCGAPNAKVNMKAPCALPGTSLPSGLTVQENTIRGIVSAGMLCSEAELELGTDKSGLYVLSPDLEAGASLAQALNLSDTILEISLTPNRSDCLSIIGIAREVAALLNKPLRLPEIILPPTEGNILDFTSVTIDHPEFCPRYAARLVMKVCVAPSPFWLKDRLLSAGLKPINNIVDITNFVMMETGQPLHAFDFDRLAENRIVVRTARENENFKTLDSKERVLTPDTLMICDGQKPVAIAGVMGGENSEIEQITTRVLIESAYFNPISIRKTGKRLGLSTDASYRFERGVDPEGTLTAVNRASQLMADIGSGRLIDGCIDAHPNPVARKKINLSVSHTNRHLGTSLNLSQIKHHLESIEFAVEETSADTLSVVPSSFRVDVSRPEDLMEEVARLWGYNNIPMTFPSTSAGIGLSNKQIEIKDRIKDLMAGMGFAESIHYSFIARSCCDRLGLAAEDDRRRMLDVLNPLNEDQAVMRTSLIPGLLESMNRNQSWQIKNLKIFELGKIFISNGQDAQPSEIEMLAGLWTGARLTHTWHVKPEPSDFYDLKGVVENLFSLLGFDRMVFSVLPAAACTFTKAGHSATFSINGKPIGMIGEVSQSALKNFDIKQPAFVFELNVSALIPLVPDFAVFESLPRFPAVERDLTLIVDNHVQAGDIVSQTESCREDLMEQVSVFDVYSGKPIPEDKKSISLRITYRSHTETLLDKEVNIIHQHITDRLLKTFNASLPA